MKQLTQKLKDGRMEVLEVPLPVVGAAMVMVRSYYSLISPGTEGSTVMAAKKSLIGKAKERPQQVKQVIDVLCQQGAVQAYRAVMKKLDAYSPLGYSCVGEVIDIGGRVNEFSIGDIVACGGLTASHAEVVVVPKNLCVKLPISKGLYGKDKGDLSQYLKMAAYNTLGAIALQGVRQADLRLGETCAVIGLGLLGQLTCHLLKASGVQTIGIDINPLMVKMASEHCAEFVLIRDENSIQERIRGFTRDIGCDAVIITAATDSLDPINFAGAIVRKRGIIVIVGAVPTGFDREPHFYKKELTIKMSCSYGPGRYDSNYEEKGHDYPISYVRWTEKRNMEAFQELIFSNKIDISPLTTHIFKLQNAPAAYDIILKKSEPYLGILIEYEVNKPLFKERILINSLSSQPCTHSTVSIAFIGAGSYAQSYLLPNLPKDKGVLLKGIMTSSGRGSRSVGEKFGFEFCTDNENDIFENSRINTVFIATRHDSHSKYVIKALKSRKHVFVEKPLCLTELELEEIRGVYASLYKSCASPPLLMVGFNRRFSPLSVLLNKKIGFGPMSIIYRVNAGHIPADSWIQDREIGGGRIIGEVCHFVDFMIFINGSFPKSVFANALPDPLYLYDTVNINLTFENDSIGMISYFANGSKSLFKEYVEIYRAGSTGVLQDFKKVEIYGNGKKFRSKVLSQDKGQKREVREFVESIRKGKMSPISSEEIFITSKVTFKILESLRTGQVVKIW